MDKYEASCMKLHIWYFASKVVFLGRHRFCWRPDLSIDHGPSFLWCWSFRCLNTSIWLTSTITPSSVRVLKDPIAVCYYPALVAWTLCSCVDVLSQHGNPTSSRSTGNKSLEDSSWMTTSFRNTFIGSSSQGSDCRLLLACPSCSDPL